MRYIGTRVSSGADSQGDLGRKSSAVIKDATEAAGGRSNPKGKMDVNPPKVLSVNFYQHFAF